MKKSHVEINRILKEHKLWLNDRKRFPTKRAILHSEDLRGLDLRGVDLRRAILTDAILDQADLSGALLGKAVLNRASLREAILDQADLSRAFLREADLSGAILHKTILDKVDFRRAILSGADLHDAIGIPPIACPEEGTFVGWKQASGRIVKLQITESAKRSSATRRICRCSEAIVLAIERIDGEEDPLVEVKSDYDENFVYRIGETVRVDNFDENRWNDCAPGIHFFLTRQEAKEY